MKDKFSVALILALLAVLASGAIVLADRAAPSSSSYLFVWAGEMNVAAMMHQAEDARRGRDFLAVFDVTPKAGRYGRLVVTLPVGNSADMPHHTNYAMPADNVLFANDFDAANTFIFDLADAVHPKLKSSFGAAGSFTHPHSFVLLENGNTLSTFQQQGNDNTAAGGLVELDPQGRAIRSASAADPQVDSFIRPYSLEVVPSLDRVISSSADMYKKDDSHVIQVWRLSDLKLLKTIALPHGVLSPMIAENSSEPRVLADRRTVFVPTFTCGLYRLDGLEGANPSAAPVYDFGGRKCSVPVVAGHYWVEALESTHCIVSLDVSDPSHPREVGRIVLGDNDLPHWLAREPQGNRIVITGYGDLFYRLLLARIDLASGKLSLDDNFREEGSDKPGFSFDRAWPDGWHGPAIPHGAVFGLPAAK
ncbi:MAG TPA: hypothetical protein VGR81_01020 [Candidatus Acidoferrales bacterium]|nr:hypothetical protein [Candidatus Acidoferrales bacterium]